MGGVIVGWDRGSERGDYHLSFQNWQTLPDDKRRLLSFGGRTAAQLYFCVFQLIADMPDDKESWAEQLQVQLTTEGE